MNSTFPLNIELVLASKSPRRRELISALGNKVSIVDIDVDERSVTLTDPSELVLALSKLKAQAFTGRLSPFQVLVTADTVVYLNGHILGKPSNKDEARSMLQSLSGTTHVVHTGVCLSKEAASGEREYHDFVEKTEVTLAPLPADLIESYLSNGSYADKAGAYGVQDSIGMLGITALRGCYYNVMGLPVSRLYFELLRFLQR